MIKEKNILTILTLAFIVVVAWIGLSIYHNSKTSTIDDITQVQIEPITPNFDTQVIDHLQERNIVAPLFSAPQNVSILPTPLPKKAVVPTPRAVTTTPALTPSPLPTASAP